MLRVCESMALIGVHNELRRHMFVAQRMPELKGLGRRTLPIAVAHNSQRRRMHLADKVDR